MRITLLITFWIGLSLASFAQTPTFVTDYQPTTFYNWQDAIQHSSTALTLDLSGWRLETLPSDIGKLEQLTHLDLSNNPLSILPNEIKQLQQLESLELENAITIQVNPLFQQLATLNNLKRLNLKNVSLMYLPVAVGQLKQLTHLNLSGNQLKKLPTNFYALSKLEVLNLSNNNFKKFKEQIKYLTQLQHLDLSYNADLKTPKSVKYLEELQQLKSLKWQGLKNVFDVVQRISTLETLDLSEGLFEDFDISDLQRLTTLNLNNCTRLNFRSAFLNLGKLDNLTTLHLEHAQEKVERGLGRIKSLETLTLGSRKMTHLPNDLKRLKNLKTLDLTNSSAFDWAKAVRQLARIPNLETLILKGCAIKNLPKNMGLLKNIKHLELNANDLTTLPNSFFKLKQLESINLYGNPLDQATLERLKTTFPDCDIQYPRSPTSIKEKVKITNTINFKNQAKKIAPPLATAQIEKITNVVNAAIESTINLESGTTIFVPENAFVDANGNPVKGKVAVSYQEFNDPLSMYLSGIPMTYETGGEVFQFKSAGMFQITATQNGKEVLINPERPLEVELDSYDDGEKFNLYQYDTTANRWQEIADEKKVVSPPNNTMEVLNNTQNKIQKPVEPRGSEVQRIHLDCFKRENNSFTFRLNFRYEHLARKFTRSRIKYTTALNEFDKVIWKYDGTNRKADFSKLKAIFDDHTSRAKFSNWFRKTKPYYSDDIIDIRIEPNVSRDNYTLQFFTLTDTLKVAAYPQFRSTHRNVSKQLKNQRFHNLYTKLLEKRCKTWDKREEEDKQAMETYEKKMEDYRNIQLLGKSKGSITLLNVRVKVVVRDLSIHNIDRPLRWKETVYEDPIILTFHDENRQEVTIDKVDILDANNNTAVRIIRDKDLQKVLSLNNATFIVELNDGRVGVAKNLNLKKMNKKGGQQFVTLQTHEKAKMTVEKMKALTACK